MPPPVAAVLFDLMDTLIYDPFQEATVAATGMPLREAFARRDPDAWPLLEIGAINDQTFATRYFPDRHGDPPLAFDLEVFHRVRLEGYRWLDGMDALMDELVGRVSMVIASNYPDWIEDVAQKFGIDRRVVEIVASCHLGVRKPSPEFFKGLLEWTGFTAEECLFVDDREVNCEGARQLGIRSHRFIGVDDLRARLRAEGIL